MPLNLTVVTAERTVLTRSDVLRVIVPTMEGQITVLPSHAPLMASLAKVQEALGDRFGKDVFFLSLTVDPVADTPPRLQAYAAKLALELAEQRVRAKLDAGTENALVDSFLHDLQKESKN